jgi:hypothetical protein
MTSEEQFIPLRLIIPWPQDKFPIPESSNDEPSFLDLVGIKSFEINENELTADVVILKEVTLGLPGLDGVEIVFGQDKTDDNFSTFHVRLILGETVSLILENISIALRFPTSWFRRMRNENGVFVEDKDESGSIRPYQISLNDITITLDTNGNIDVHFIDGTPSIELQPAMIGNSGIIVEAKSIVLCFSEESVNSLPPSIPRNFRGIYVDDLSVHLPKDISVALPDNVVLEDFLIGSGGISGRVSGHWLPQLSADGKSFTGNGSGTIFDIPFAIQDLGIELIQNALVSSNITGAIIFPFFEQPVLVEVGLTMNGDFTIGLSADQSTLPVPPDQLPQRNSEGLFVFTKKDLMNLIIKGLSFEHIGDIFSIKIGGSIKPLVRGINWPEFEVESLSINSQGHVKIDGGWVDIPTQKSFELYGFSVNITKIGFGNEEDGAKWIGLSGGIKLVDGLPLEGSVEGLRVKWKSSTDIELEIGGVRVAFEIKDVLKFSGSATFIDEPTKKGFKGGVKMVLYPFDGCSLDTQLIVGKNSITPSYTFFYTYTSADLPIGIPLFSTGLALYGMAGLFGYNIEPSKGKAGNPNEAWYENSDGSPGWYLRDVPGVTDASTKWLDKFESIAFGAGITIGTLPDNGFKFSAKTLIALLIPGPIMIVEGKANFLKERKKLDENPLFRVLAVYDNRAGTFLMNIETNYSLPEDSGKVIKIRALAEAFFDFNNSQNWHLYIGQDQPDAKRIRAEILKLFEANAYFMLTSADLSMGAWIGYDNEWKFGPLQVKLSAWMEGRTKVTFKPAQAEGELTLQGDVELRAFGVSVDLNVAAGVQVQTPNPFFVYAEFRVKLNLPWPLPDPKADVVLEWKEEQVPPIPVPISKFGMEHLKVSEKWTLNRYPEYDNNSDGFSDGSQIAEPDNAILTSPLIPVDGRPVIVFAKPVEDVAMIGDNSMPAPPPENIGQGYQYQYRLVKVILEKTPRNQNTGGWTVVGVKSSIASENMGELYGNWQLATENNNQTNTKLMLWTNTPFEISRELSNSDIFSGPIIVIYNPCGLNTIPEEICVDFEGYSPETMLPLVSLHDGTILYTTRGVSVVNYNASWCGTTKALVFSSRVAIRTESTPLLAFEEFADFRGIFFIAFSERVAKVDLCLGKDTSIIVDVFDDKGGLEPVFSRTFDIPADTPDMDMKPVSIEGDSLMAFRIMGHGLLAKICYTSTQEMLRVKNNEALQTHTKESTELHWDQHKNVLFEPNMYYKLTAISQVIVNDSEIFEFAQHCYFQTAGPPGAYSQTISASRDSLVPTSSARLPEDGPLKDLTAYVLDTIPKIGQKPVYRSYDIGVIFNEPYVDQMYLMSGMALAIELFDNNDNPVQGADGLPISLQNQWGDNPQVFITREEQQWIRMLDQKGCITLDYQHKLRNRNLYSGHKMMSLKPETLYKARITAISNADSKKYVVFQFSFITSKYASFTDQIQSFQDVIWSHGRLLGSITPLFTSENKTILEDVLSSVNPGNSYDADTENKKFQQINELFGLGIRQLPRSLEILALDDNTELVTENSRSYGYLIESPEPIDWNRVSLTASFRAEGYGTEPVQEATEAIKILGAGISSSGGDSNGYNSEWIDFIVREKFDISNILIEHKSVGLAEFQEYFRFGTENYLPAGTIIRIHSGRKQDDTNPSQDLEHRYVESNNWHFSSAGEMIRITNKGGNILDSRYIASQESYISKDIILIRNADNTRAFVFLPSTVERAGPIDNGNYMFSFRYRLNIGDNSLILRRMSGIDAEEETYIEFSYPAILPE